MVPKKNLLFLRLCFCFISCWFSSLDNEIQFHSISTGQCRMQNVFDFSVVLPVCFLLGKKSCLHFSCAFHFTSQTMHGCGWGSLGITCSWKRKSVIIHHFVPRILVFVVAFASRTPPLVLCSRWQPLKSKTHHRYASVFCPCVFFFAFALSTLRWYSLCCYLETPFPRRRIHLGVFFALWFQAPVKAKCFVLSSLFLESYELRRGVTCTVHVFCCPCVVALGARTLAVMLCPCAAQDGGPGPSVRTSWYAQHVSPCQEVQQALYLGMGTCVGSVSSTDDHAYGFQSFGQPSASWEKKMRIWRGEV